MRFKNFFIMVFAVFALAGCKTNPFTGEKNLNFVSNQQLFPMAFQQYDEFLAENNVVTGTAEANMVKNVGQKIVVAAERFLNANGHQGYLNDFQWEFNLVNDEAVNAWAMPGGKIVFYTGILPVAQSETGVAAVMAHEVANSPTDHGAQRMSAGQLQHPAGVADSLAFTVRSQHTQQKF